MIELGSRVRDMITGFEGVAIARSEWLHGLLRFAVQSTVLKDNRPVEEVWFDAPRLERISKAPPIQAEGGDLSHRAKEEGRIKITIEGSAVLPLSKN